jgi:FkbH-like protein
MWEFEWGSSKSFDLSDIPIVTYPYGTRFIPMSWEEHCTECAIPGCYDSCSLFSKRIDGACSRFENGIQRVSTNQGVFAHVVFKQWGKLESLMTDKSLGFRFHSFLIYLNNVSTKLAEAGPTSKITFIWGWLISRVRRRIVRNIGSKVNVDASKFLHSIIYNPGDPTSIAIELSVLGIGVFRDSIFLKTGWTEKMIELQGWSTQNQTLLRLLPNPQSKTELLFHTLNVVVPIGESRFQFSNLEAENFNKDDRYLSPVKCVVWDLDGTIWDGILAESGDRPQMVLRHRILETLENLDTRGILNSIASKNNSTETLSVLEDLGIAHFFVSPQINWKHKSENLLQIASDLNLNLSDFLFVDDTKFEIDEVKNTHPTIRTLDASQTSSMLELPFLNPSSPSLGFSRRVFYQEESKRKIDLSQSALSFNDFLRSCNMQLTIRSLNKQQDFDRGFELLNRSNQLNFSGLRLSYEDFKNSTLDTDSLWICADLEDKYGTHGIILVGKIELKPNFKIAELAISCRVAGKYVEETFFQWVIDTFSNKHDLLELGYVETPRNGLIRDAINRSGFHFDTSTNTYKTALPKRIAASELISVISNL